MERFLIVNCCAIPFSEIIRVFEGHADFQSVYIDKFENFYRAIPELEINPWDLTPCQPEEIDLNGAIVHDHELPALLELKLVQLPAASE